MEMNTVAGSHQEKVVCLQQSIPIYIYIQLRYQQVCGRVARYEKDGPDGFQPFSVRNLTINQDYFEGLSIMYGTPRQHIWTKLDIKIFQKFLKGTQS